MSGAGEPSDQEQDKKTNPADSEECFKGGRKMSKRCFWIWLSCEDDEDKEQQNLQMHERSTLIW